MDPRSARIRLTDVAKLAGVSTTTASRALNGRGELTPETRAAVLDAAAQLGFRPSPFAQLLRTRRSHTVGLIVPHVDHPFYASILQGAQSYLKKVGYRLVLVDAGDDPEGVADAIETLLDHWVDGILIATTPFTAARFTELLRGTPCVFIDETVPDVGVGNVTLDNSEGVAALVEHLAWHGYTKIGFLGGPADRTDGQERLAGYQSAMAARSLAVLPGLVRECEWSLRSGVEQTLGLLDTGLAPDAIAASSIELALGALAACRSRGLRLPDDLAIASFDDTYFAPLVEPALTTISYDAPAMGSQSAELLVNAIDGENPGYEELRIGVRLVRRRSCGCEFDVMSALGVA